MANNGQKVNLIIKKKYGAESAQRLINTLLWKIINQNGGVIHIKPDEVKNVPPNAKLRVQYNQSSGNIMVVAAVDKGIRLYRPNELLLP